MHASLVVVGALSAIHASAPAGHSQSYPFWFLEQGRVACADVAVGYARPGYYQDSATGEALLDGQCHAARQRRTVVRGGELFWQTAIGSAYLGGDLEERFDSAACDTPLTVTGLDTLVTANLVAVLVAGRACGLADGLRRLADCAEQGRPAWVEELPDGPGYVYALGTAPLYHYEVTSWREAERRARLELARTLGTRVRALERSGDTGRDALLGDSLSVVLRGVQVIGRWREGNEACHVVARVPAGSPAP